MKNYCVSSVVFSQRISNLGSELQHKEHSAPIAIDNLPLTKGREYIYDVL